METPTGITMTVRFRIPIRTPTPGGRGISGQVTLSGAGFNGVTMTLTGSQSGSIVTGGSGNYSFTNLTAAGTYTVTPSLSGYGFTPSSVTFTNLSGSQTANFTAVAPAS